MVEYFPRISQKKLLKVLCLLQALLYY